MTYKSQHCRSIRRVSCVALLLMGSISLFAQAPPSADTFVSSATPPYGAISIFTC